MTDPEQEKVFKVEVTSPDAGSQQKLVRLPRKKEEGEHDLEQKVSEILTRTQDSRVRIDVLIKLLNKELSHEE